MGGSSVRGRRRALSQSRRYSDRPLRRVRFRNWFASTGTRDIATIRAEFDTLENGLVQQGLREDALQHEGPEIFKLAFEVFGRCDSTRRVE